MVLKMMFMLALVCGGISSVFANQPAEKAEEKKEEVAVAEKPAADEKQAEATTEAAK